VKQIIPKHVNTICSSFLSRKERPITIIAGIKEALAVKVEINAAILKNVSEVAN